MNTLIKRVEHLERSTRGPAAITAVVWHVVEPGRLGVPVRVARFFGSELTRNVGEDENGFINRAVAAARRRNPQGLDAMPSLCVE